MLEANFSLFYIKSSAEGEEVVERVDLDPGDEVRVVPVNGDDPVDITVADPSTMSITADASLLNKRYASIFASDEVNGEVAEHEVVLDEGDKVIVNPDTDESVEFVVASPGELDIESSDPSNAEGAVSEASASVTPAAPSAQPSSPSSSPAPALATAPSAPSAPPISSPQISMASNIRLQAIRLASRASRAGLAELSSAIKLGLKAMSSVSSTQSIMSVSTNVYRTKDGDSVYGPLAKVREAVGAEKFDAACKEQGFLSAYGNSKSLQIIGCSKCGPEGSKYGWCNFEQFSTINEAHEFYDNV